MRVSDKLLERKPEWRTFAMEETEGRARTGLPSSLARHDMGLSTVIGKENMDVFELHLKIPTVDTAKCIARVANKGNISEKSTKQ